MNEIYVLITGEYSDWRIQGFVESEEEAIKICEIHNKNVTWSHNELYYLSTEKFNNYSKEQLDSVKSLYGYRIDAWKENNEWHFSLVEDIDVELVDEDYIDVELTYFNTRAYITVCLEEVNREKALKIAQDMLYKKLAEKEGL